ncbi:MAG: fatty acid desaturase, partial [Deltaproteobacteria bacterium]|nr:fatty acid desaturase [Deltaproteobacteria bacterium]
MDGPAAGLVAKEDLRRWMKPASGPGLARVAVQLPLLVVSLVATVWLAGAGNPAWIAAVLLAGTVLVGFFAALHEAGHKTAFRSRPLNESLVWLAAFLMLQCPSFFREFHWEHHRETQSPTRDPELGGQAWLLGGWPSNLGIYPFRASGQALLAGKALFTVTSALLVTAAQWEKIFPFVRPDHRRRVQWESRLAIALWSAIFHFGSRDVPGFENALLAWPIAHVWMGLFVTAEHSGRAIEGTQLERTRTTRSNALVRFHMWNMNYRAEHHAFPAVPGHALPELHRALGDGVHVTGGYLAFHAEALRRSLRGDTAPATNPPG